MFFGMISPECDHVLTVIRQAGVFPCLLKRAAKFSFLFMIIILMTLIIEWVQFMGRGYPKKIAKIYIMTIACVDVYSY